MFSYTAFRPTTACTTVQAVEEIVMFWTFWYLIFLDIRPRPILYCLLLSFSLLHFWYLFLLFRYDILFLSSCPSNTEQIVTCPVECIDISASAIAAVTVIAYVSTPSKETDGRTNERTDRRRKQNLVHFSLKMWHLVAIIFIIFLIINWPNFVYL